MSGEEAICKVWRKVFQTSLIFTILFFLIIPHHDKYFQLQHVYNKT